MHASLLRAGHPPVRLAELSPVPGHGVYQATFRVPEIIETDASPELEVRFREPDKDEIVERVSIALGTKRDAIEAKHTVASSSSQWADDTEPQTRPHLVDLAPFGRTLAGFGNVFMIRVMDIDGKGHRTPVRVRLLSGEFAGKIGSQATPPVIHMGATNAIGLAEFAGIQASEVLRFEVQIGDEATRAVEETTPTSPPLSPDATPSAPAPASNTTGDQDRSRLAANKAAPTLHRRFRFVSFSGGVRLTAPTLQVRPGQEIEIGLRSLRKGKQMHIDVRASDGSWCDTAAISASSQGSRNWTWTVPRSMPPGVAQLEAYPYTNAPGESSALVRVQVVDANATRKAARQQLIEHHRARIHLPRASKHYNAAHEKAYLTHLQQLELDAAEDDAARLWLLGTLPIELYGPPVALSTRERNEAALAVRKRRWTVGLRWLLLGGGGCFIALAAFSLAQAQRRQRAAIDRQLLGAGWDEGAISEHRQTMRPMILRGLILILILAAGLATTVLLLENLVQVR
ncbi:MAG: hypothetical protein V3V08_25515 [Nannocystaceae bacterium]